MWKYVSRRIRDVCDKTCNVLDVRRPWQCGSERICVDNLPGERQDEKIERSNSDGPKVTSFCLLKLSDHVPGGGKRSDTGSNNSEKEGFRRKEYCSFQHSWIGAITWTSAIICGWYTSQLICLYRRNHKWEGPKYLPYLISSAHKLPHGFHNFQFQKCFPFSGPPAPQIEPIPERKESSRNVKLFGFPISTDFNDNFLQYDFNGGPNSQFAFPVNNEGNQKANVVHDLPVVEEKSQEPPNSTVESAMKNLLTVVGEIEYQLGVQNLEVGNYETAISHLKLGASHQHAGAAFNLGICYEQGFGVRKNSRVAMECFYLASCLGHPQAMYNLGVYYARGLGGLKRSRTMAKKYFMAAAELGLQEAIAALGPSYKARRDSMQAGPSTESSPAIVPYEFKFDYQELERYAFGGLKSTEQFDQIELRLVSAMA